MGRKVLEINPECGRRLEEWLKWSGYKAREVAEAIHYTPQHLSGVINGKKRMTPELAEAIASWVWEKQTEAHKNDSHLSFHIDRAVRAEWLLCKDNYMTRDAIYAADEEEMEKAERIDGILRMLLVDGFEDLGYDLRFGYYVDYPDDRGYQWPDYDEGYYEIVNSSSGEVEGSFPDVIMEQAVWQYVDYGKQLAQSIINRSTPTMKKRVQEGNAKMVRKQESERTKEEDHGKSTGKKK